uniref:Protein transport protein sec16 n=1 Tax=Panagrellus redivivus TaxID=6233 RepID=A0A7E4WAQ5_PANRE
MCRTEIASGRRSRAVGQTINSVLDQRVDPRLQFFAMTKKESASVLHALAPTRIRQNPYFDSISTSVFCSPMDEDDRNIFADAARLFFSARKSNDDGPDADGSNVKADANPSTKGVETSPKSTQAANEDAQGSPMSGDSLEVDLWSNNVEDWMNLANVSDDVQFAPLDLSASATSASAAPSLLRSPKMEMPFDDSDSSSEDANLAKSIKTEAITDQTFRHSDAQSVSRDGSMPASSTAVPADVSSHPEKIDVESLLERDFDLTSSSADVKIASISGSGAAAPDKPLSTVPTRPSDPANVLTGDGSGADVDLTVSISDSAKSADNCASHTGDSLITPDVNKPASPWPYPIEVPTSHPYYDAMMAVRMKEAEKDKDNSRMPVNNNKATASKEKQQRSASKPPQQQVRPLTPVPVGIPVAPVQAQNTGNLRHASGNVLPAHVASPGLAPNLPGYAQPAQNVILTPPPPPPLMLVPSPSAGFVAKNLVPPPMRPYQNAVPSQLHRDAIQRQQAHELHQQGMHQHEMINYQQHLKKQRGQQSSAPQKPPIRPVPSCPPPYGYQQGPYPYSMQYLPYSGLYGRPPPGYYPHQVPPQPYPFMYNQTMGNQPQSAQALGHHPHPAQALVNQRHPAPASGNQQHPMRNLPHPHAVPARMNQVPYSTQHEPNRQMRPPNQRIPQPQPPFVYHPPNQHVLRHAASHPNHRESPLPPPPTAPRLVPEVRPASSQNQKTEAPRHHGPLDPIDSDFFLRFAARQAATVTQQQQHLHSAPQVPAAQKDTLKFPGSYPRQAEQRNVARERPNPTAPLPQHHPQRRFIPPTSSENHGYRPAPTNVDRRCASQSFSSLSAASRDNVKRVLSKHHKQPTQQWSFEPHLPRNSVRSLSPTRSTSPQVGTSAKLMKPMYQRNPQKTTSNETVANNSIDDDADFTMPSPPRMSLSPMPRKRRKIFESEQSMEDAFDKADRQSPIPQPQVRDAVSNCPIAASSSTESVASEKRHNDPDNASEAEVEDDVIYIDSDDDGTIIIGSETDDSDLEIEDFIQTEAEEEPFVYSDPKFNFINPKLNNECNGDLNGLEWIEELLKNMKKEGTFEQHFSGKDVKDAEWEIRSYITDTRQKQREVSTSRRLMNCILQEVDEPWLKRYKEKCLSYFDAKPEDAKPDVKDVVKLEEGEIVE